MPGKSPFTEVTLSYNFFTYCSVLDNWSWWRDVGAVEFMADIARPFRVASMLAKDRSGEIKDCTCPWIMSWLYSVSQRMASEEGMSCAEFLYPCLQAFDFLYLHQHNDCWLQVSYIPRIVS